MTTLVEELRTLAHPCEIDTAGQCQTEKGKPFQRGEHVAFHTAAILVEADPLYKAARDLLELVRVGNRYLTEPFFRPYAGEFWTEWSKRAEAALATLPKD